MRLTDVDKLIEELEELEQYFENESNHPDDGLANPQRYRDTMSGVAQGLNHAITVVLDAPPAEAIPIEWILDWDKKNSNDYTFTNSVIPNMLEDWRNELNK